MKQDIFPHFPQETICVVCKTNVQGQTILVPIDGTQNGLNCQATPVHLNCVIPTNYNREMKIFYSNHE